MSGTARTKRRPFNIEPEFLDGFLRRVAVGVLPGPYSDGRGGSALHIAAEDGEVDVCRRLIEYGADIWMRDTALELPVHRAAAAGHVGVCQLLLEAAGQMRATLLGKRAGSDLTAFQEAVRYGRVELIRYFVLECAEDPSQRTSAMNRPVAQLNQRDPEGMKEMLRSLAIEVSLTRELQGNDGASSPPARRSVAAGPI